MQRLIAAVLPSICLLAPLGAGAADLVVWWEKGFYAQEDEAVREIVAAFEQKTGKQVELARPRTLEVCETPQFHAHVAEIRRIFFGYGVI
jgi:hypothetical protein